MKTKLIITLLSWVYCLGGSAQTLLVGVNEQHTTIKEALLAASGGETIVIADAEHVEESLIENLNFSSPVVITSPASQRSTIKGIEQLNLNWTSHEGSIYKASLNQDEWSYNKAEQTIYAYANDISDLQNSVFEGKTQSYALEFVNCSNIRMEGIEFLGTTFKATDVTNFTVYDCEFNFPSASKRMIGGYDPIELTLIDNTNSMGSVVLVW